VGTLVINIQKRGGGHIMRILGITVLVIGIALLISCGRNMDKQANDLNNAIRHEKSGNRLGAIDNKSGDIYDGQEKRDINPDNIDLMPTGVVQENICNDEKRVNDEEVRKSKGDGGEIAPSSDTENVLWRRSIREFREYMGQVEEGWTSEQLLRYAGEPDRRRSDNDNIWYYCHPRVLCSGLNIIYRMTIEDGIVSEIKELVQRPNHRRG
jgi:hypothetical protein